MMKAPIKNPSIGIKPSQKMIDFIKSLNDTTIDLPENLLKIYKAITQDTRKRGVSKQSILLKGFTEEEKKLLVAFSDDTFQNTTDLQNCIKSLHLSTFDDNNDESDSDIEEVSKNKHISNNKARQMRARQREKEISKLALNLSDLKWIHQHLSDTRRENDSVNYLHELIEGSLIILPSNEFTERNPELEERCQRLKREQDEQKYRHMTKNVDCSRSYEPEETIAYQVKQINRQLIAVLQFVFSVAAGFAFGFIGVELLVGNLDFGFRLLLGIICALIIALAEIYFLAKKLNEELDDVNQSVYNQAMDLKSNGSKVETVKEHND
ncbi:uncharacterized protein LOC116339290 [Contarinia nasturtii]|uniref:uncharacterized protein LOC116339290 n=1 Tax=Contarinia nasturtii TaxID=265458 RepID=UPI0012D47C7E|nr:uncharacterized protein LOC116339290 [Contarinia nasturtii]